LEGPLWPFLFSLCRAEGPRINFKKIGGGVTRYQHLSVYQALYSLSLQVYRLKLKLPKSVKHDLGQIFFESTVRCIRGVILANGSANKVRPLQQTLLEFETLWVYSRLLFDLRAISTGEFKNLSEILSDSGKQLNAWLKWEKQHAKIAVPPEP
jgi:hypothetical protein